MMRRKLYLGDAVYVARDNFGRLVLTTENGIETTNRIILEPEVYRALTEYVAAADAADERRSDT